MIKLIIDYSDLDCDLHCEFSRSKGQKERSNFHSQQKPYLNTQSNMSNKE